MPTVEETVAYITAATTWDQRVARIRQVPQRHGTDDLPTIHAEVTVLPAPDFVVFDDTDTLRAMLECKGANDGGTARDKALRFERLRDEAIRLGGIPLLGVLRGLGWTRVNDTLGPVVRDCDGRVFTLSTLPEMLTVTPFHRSPI